MLTSVQSGGGFVTISGSLNSTPGDSFRVEFFADATSDPSNHGQGQQFIGSTNVTTNSITGNAAVFAVLPVGALVGSIASSTATDIGTGDTSEFSLNTAIINTGPNPFVVTNTNDSGTGSLRQVILNVNANVGSTPTVTFAIPGVGVQTITPGSALPAITAPGFFDAYTQPGSSANTSQSADNAVINVLLQGPLSGGAINGLVIQSPNVTIRGLAIGRFGLGSGILLAAGGNDVIVGNFLGTDASGTTAAANFEGITFQTASNSIGGVAPADRNVISGNLDSGIIGVGSSVTANVVQGNFVGTDTTGVNALANRSIGVALTNGPFGNTVGGLGSPGVINVISGNGADGVRLLSGGAGNAVLANRIGNDWSGTIAIPNGANGIELNQTPGALIYGNVISGNSIAGINVFGTGSTNESITGNQIGTDAGVTIAIPNLGDGIDISSGASSVTIGSTTSGLGNVISGNIGHGVFALGLGLTAILIEGNFVGLNLLARAR